MYLGLQRGKRGPSHLGVPGSHQVSYGNDMKSKSIAKIGLTRSFGDGRSRCTCGELLPGEIIQNG